MNDDSGTRDSLNLIHTWCTDITDPGERGFALGSTWRDQVHTTWAEYEDLFATRSVPESTVRTIAESTRDLVAVHAPDLLAEIDATAAGAGLVPWQTMAINARTEILARAAAQVQECSTAVLLPADGGPPRSMQTWDWYSQMAHETLVHRHTNPDGTRVVAFGEIGQVAKIGVSSRGIGVHLNILQHRTDGDTLGVPVHLVARMILDRAATVTEAAAIADSVPLGASTVLTVVSAEPGAACLELSGAGCAVIPAAPGTPLLHTNHFLDPDLAADELTPVTFGTTHERLAFLAERPDAVGHRDPLARVRALASSAPGSICVDPDPRRAPHDRPQTKGTFTIDVERSELGFAPSHPRDITADTWRTMAAVPAG